MKVLHASGDAEDVVVHQGVLDPGLPFVSKSYTPQPLAAAVRRLLEGEPVEPAPGIFRGSFAPPATIDTSAPVY
ncbi:MAG: hypothetical protein RBU45_11215 [Myxococcota bacterium]|jgi:hypothetical protein|nr:hypothetical protein [Myxococcota bacterium]